MKEIRPRSSARTLALSTIQILVFGLLPLFALVTGFWTAVFDLGVPDFELAFYPAAEAVWDGASPYPSVDDPVVAAGIAYVYPPLTAIAVVPFTLLSAQQASVIVVLLLTAGAVGALLVLGIRDWRCYALALAWPTFFSAFQTGNVTIPLALLAALAWRFRDRPALGGIALGVSFALKPILWPLLIWYLATRRFLAAVVSLAVGASVLVASWAVIGFAGLREYPDLVRRLQELEEPHGYTVYALALDVGLSSELARVLGLALAASLLLGVVVVARRLDDRGAFVLAVAASLACSPIVWLHYFALLLVAVAVAQPALGLAWFVPLAMYLSTGTHNGTTFQTAITIAAAAVTVAIALRATSRPEPLLRLGRPSVTSLAEGRP